MSTKLFSLDITQSSIQWQRSRVIWLKEGEKYLNKKVHGVDSRRQGGDKSLF